MRSSIQTRNDGAGYMLRAVELARKGSGWTSPNPMVGAVLVKDGRIIGEGYHERCGGPHAEINALNNSIESPFNSTFYVSLQPCNSTGKTPPCVDTILENKIRKVVIGSVDPTQERGIEALIDAGVEVEIAISEEAQKLNRPFFTLNKLKRPYVTVKIASTLDGKIAAESGDSKWITSEDARVAGHRLRHESDAILVGINTIEKDNPFLTARVPNANPHHPLRIILDSGMRISPSSNVVTDGTAPTWIATLSGVKSLPGRPVRIIQCEKQDNKVDIKDLLRKLGEERIASLLVEGGPTVIGEFFRAGLVDRVVQFISPSYLGGSGLDAVGPLNISNLSDRILLKNVVIQRYGEDFMIEGEVCV